MKNLHTKISVHATEHKPTKRITDDNIVINEYSYTFELMENDTTHTLNVISRNRELFFSSTSFDVPELNNLIRIMMRVGVRHVISTLKAVKQYCIVAGQPLAFTSIDQLDKGTRGQYIPVES